MLPNYPNGQRPSSFLRSSLEGAIAALGGNSNHYDSPFEYGIGGEGALTSRPSKPKIDPFKKLDKLPLS